MASILVKGVLNLIDTVLAQGGEDARDLANVLTALRGVDGMEKGDAKEVKKRTTAVIRAAAFPLTLNSPHRLEDLQWTMKGHDGRIYATDLELLDHHFVRHLEQAARALDVEVVPVNACKRTLSEALGGVEFVRNDS